MPRSNSPTEAPCNSWLTGPFKKGLGPRVWVVSPAAFLQRLPKGVVFSSTPPAPLSLADHSNKPPNSHQAPTSGGTRTKHGAGKQQVSDPPRVILRIDEIHLATQEIRKSICMVSKWCRISSIHGKDGNIVGQTLNRQKDHFRLNCQSAEGNTGGT